jgi:hypothetical protein
VSSWGIPDDARRVSNSGAIPAPVVESPHLVDMQPAHGAQFTGYLRQDDDAFGHQFFQAAPRKRTAACVALGGDEGTDTQVVEASDQLVEQLANRLFGTIAREQVIDGDALRACRR